MTEKQRFEQAIEEAFEEFACDSANPCGGTGYYEPDEDKPYRVLFCDGAECERFATVAEAVKAAEEYRDQMRRDA